MVCKSTNSKIPYFNAPIYLENKNQIGKIDEILGPMNEVYFTVKLQEGIVATSFKPNDKVYIGEDKLLPLERFLPKPPAPKKGEMINKWFSFNWILINDWKFNFNLIDTKKKPAGICEY